jgi:hypothetical protein
VEGELELEGRKVTGNLLFNLLAQKTFIFYILNARRFKNPQKSVKNQRFLTPTKNLWFFVAEEISFPQV